MVCKICNICKRKKTLEILEWLIQAVQSGNYIGAESVLWDIWQELKAPGLVCMFLRIDGVIDSFVRQGTSQNCRKQNKRRTQSACCYFSQSQAGKVW